MEGQEPVTPFINSSEQIDQLAAALVAAQAEMPRVAKTKLNPFFKSKYADLASVVDVVGPVISKHGLTVPQFVSHREDRTTLKTFLVHASGQWIGDEMVLHMSKNTPQDQGSAITYARRYAYCSVLGIVADDDDDGNAASVGAQTNRDTNTRQVGGDESGEKKTTRVKAPASTGEGASNGTSGALRGLFAALKGISVTDENRLQWASERLSRDVESFNDLTEDDIKALKTAARDQAKGQTSSKPAVQVEDPLAYRPDESPF